MMKPRERVLTALSHKEPDKVPVDMGSSRATTIHAIAYNHLKDYLGMKGGATCVYDIWQQIAHVEEELVKRLHIDVIPLNLLRVHFGLSNAEWKPYVLPDDSLAEISSEFNEVKDADGSRTLLNSEGLAIARMPKGSFYFDHIYFPLESAETTSDIDKFDWEGQLLPDDEFEYLSKESKRLFEETDYAINGHFGGSLFEFSQMIRGYTNTMLDIGDNNRLINYLLDRMTEIHLENLRRYFDAVDNRIQVIYVADDLGTQNSLWMSPDSYRKIFKPRHAKIYNYIKDRSDCFIFLHSCGAIYDLIPDLIDIGVDIISPVQTSAKGMEPERLKREFGEKLTFWGAGIETQTVLPKGTSEDIRRQVKERIRILGPDGGFVFNTVHNIQPDVPPENIMAMFDAVEEFRAY
jgi:uroporphyrinogen decarboxylase